jgi:hypothetical protein
MISKIANYKKRLEDKAEKFITYSAYDMDPLQIMDLLGLTEAEAWYLAKKYGGEIWQKRVQLAKDGFWEHPFSNLQVDDDD